MDPKKDIYGPCASRPDRPGEPDRGKSLAVETCRQTGTLDSLVLKSGQFLFQWRPVDSFYSTNIITRRSWAALYSISYFVGHLCSLCVPSLLYDNYMWPLTTEVSQQQSLIGEGGQRPSNPKRKRYPCRKTLGAGVVSLAYETVDTGRPPRVEGLLGKKAILQRKF